MPIGTHSTDRNHSSTTIEPIHPTADGKRNLRAPHDTKMLSAIVDTMASVAVPFAIIALGGGAGDIGLVLSARAIPLILFLLVGGVWADRIKLAQEKGMEPLVEPTLARWFTEGYVKSGAPALKRT